MAATYTSVPGPMGSGGAQATGPEAWGTYGVEPIKIVIDGVAMTSLVVKPTWLRSIDWIVGAWASSVVIDNTVTPPTATLTIPSTVSQTSFVLVGGRGR